MLAGLLALLLAGCGSAGKPEGKRVRAAGYSFVAPTGWDVRRTPRKTSVRSGSQLLSVEIFPLVHAYDPLLFAKVKIELDRLAAEIAANAGGSLTQKRTTQVAGRRVRAYEIVLTRNGKTLTERIAFVLEGKREYQLLCRRRAGATSSACGTLVKSFVLV